MGCLSYDPSCEYIEEVCVLQWIVSGKKNRNKMETILLTHLQRVSMLPTGSYDDDDILTEAPRG